MPVSECVSRQVQPDRTWSLDPSRDKRSPGEGTGAERPEPPSGPEYIAPVQYPILLEAAQLPLREADYCSLYPLSLHPAPADNSALLVATIELGRPPALDTDEPLALPAPIIVTRASVGSAGAGHDEEGKMSQDKKKRSTNRIMFVKKILMKDGSTVSCGGRGTYLLTYLSWTALLLGHIHT